jgi:peptide/nickel transport system permease protein
MWGYAIRRFIYMVALLVALSIVVFAIIQLPPGDYLTSYLTRLRIEGRTEDDEATIQMLEERYYLNLPMHMQYLKWVGGLLRGNLGKSFYWDRPINDLLAERLPLTISLSMATLVFTYTLAVPVGVYCATHQNSAVDYAVTVISFVGVGMPNFLLALIVMYLLHKWFGLSVGGIFSPEYRVAAWSVGRVIDFLKHLVAPMIIVGLSGTSGLVRVMRANMLDELRKPYVTTASTAVQVPAAHRAESDPEHDRLDAAGHLFRLCDRLHGAAAADGGALAGGSAALARLLCSREHRDDLDRADADRDADLGHSAGGSRPANPDAKGEMRR